MRSFIIGAAVAVAALGLVRFALEPWPDPTHYHANWAIYLDGDRLDLSADRYMEDASACTGAGHVLPTERVHMHDNNDDVVHVHHNGVTWGHFLSNLGFGLGDDYLILDDDRHLIEQDGHTLKFVVNGFPVPSVRNRVVESGDRVLISYGEASEYQVLEEQFPTVATNAEEYNQRDDPTGCAGDVDLGFWERLRRAFWG